MLRGDTALAGGIAVERRGQLEGNGFGTSSYTLYEASSPGQQHESPYLLVWLHGQDFGDIPKGDLCTMQRRLGRRTFFLVPLSPKPAEDGRRFFWGIGYTKRQNKRDLGFVFGEFHTEYLEALTALVRQTSYDVGAVRVLVAGYSMGGFGAYQLGCYAPEIFDAVVSLAGYGLGTLEPPDRGFGAPQPESGAVFRGFLEVPVRRLAAVPLVLVVHARRDTVSSFCDAAEIVKAVQRHSGHALLVEVPDEAADSDPSRKKKPHLGHHYFNYALLHESSDEVLWGRLRMAFTRVPCRQELVVPCTPPELHVEPATKRTRQASWEPYQE